MESIYSLIVEKKFVLLTAVLIGLIVRTLKSDTKIPINIPPRLRVWLAFGLGAAASVLERIGTGVGWKQAALDGALAAVLAVLGQNVIIDSLRGGKEITIPGLILPGAAPSPDKPITVPPPAAPPPPSEGPLQ